MTNGPMMSLKDLLGADCVRKSGLTWIFPDASSREGFVPTDLDQGKVGIQEDSGNIWIWDPECGWRLCVPEDVIVYSNRVPERISATEQVRKDLRITVGLRRVTFKHRGMLINLPGFVPANEARRGVIPKMILETVLESFPCYEGGRVIAEDGDQVRDLGVLPIRGEEPR